MAYFKAQPKDVGRSGGLSPKDAQAEPPRKIPAEVLRRLEKSLTAERQAREQTPKKK